MTGGARHPAIHLARVGLAVTALLLAQVMAAPAQSANPSTQTGDLPRLELTQGQKDTIYLSITNQNLRNETPADFQPIVGAVVPTTVELEAMPKTIVELAPRTEAFRIARIVNQVVIIDPQTRRVVEVITGKSL